MSSLAQLYQFELEALQSAGIPVPEPQTRAYHHQQEYPRRDSSPVGYPPHPTHRRRNSHTSSSSSMQIYNADYLYPGRQSEVRYLDPSTGISQSHLSTGSGKIRMPRGDHTSNNHGGWAAPSRNHFTPAPGPVAEEQQCCSSRSSRRCSYVARIEPTPNSDHSSSSRSPSPCCSSLSRQSSRSSAKRVMFAE